MITRASSNTLGLVPGKAAIALVKAPWVILASANSGLVFSARNQFRGKVTSVIPGAVNTTIHLVTGSGLTLTSTITNESVAEMQVSIGSELIALIKASSVILATKA